MIRAFGSFIAAVALALLAIVQPFARAEPATTAPATNPLSLLVFDPATVHGSAGFFRIGKTTSGRWLFLDPDGQPFFYRGVTSINRSGRPGGRRATTGPYSAAVDAKYGGATPQFVQAVISRLHSWNFNALGAWTTSEFFDQGMPYTEITEFALVGPHLARSNFPDVFDPAWIAAVDAQSKAICLPRRDSKLLVGYFTDNELGWYQREGETEEAQSRPVAAPRGRPQRTMLQLFITQPAGVPGAKAAWDFALARHGGDVSALSKAWGINFASQAELLKATQRLAISSPLYNADCDAFSQQVAENYFRICAEGIRRYDPNHLILGCRFGGPPGKIILEACRAPWVDVVSANNYRTNLSQRIDLYHRHHQMPVIIGEFDWCSGHFTEGTTRSTVAAQIERLGRASLEEAMRNPAMVGYTWYRWVAADSSPTSNGLVDHQDNPHPLHTRLLTDINGRADAIAASAKGQ